MVWRGRRAKLGRMPQQAGRGTPSQAGKDATTRLERNAKPSGRDTKPSKCLTNKVWRGRQTKQEMDTTQNGRGTPSQAGKDATPSGRGTKPSKCLINKVWRGRQTKQEMDAKLSGEGRQPKLGRTPQKTGEERQTKREGYETEQMLD